LETSKSLDRNQPQKRVKHFGQALNAPTRSSLDLKHFNQRMSSDAKSQLINFATGDSRSQQAAALDGIQKVSTFEHRRRSNGSY
jgi:hypothetical protein